MKDNNSSSNPTPMQYEKMFRDATTKEARDSILNAPHQEDKWTYIFNKAQVAKDFYTITKLEETDFAKNKTHDISQFYKVELYNIALNDDERLLNEILSLKPELANSALVMACEVGSVTLIKNLVQQSQINMSFITESQESFLKILCSNADQYKASQLLEVMDILIDTANHQKYLKELLQPNTLNATPLFSAILISDYETATQAIDKIINASNACQINSFLSGRNPLVTVLNRDDEKVQLLLNTLTKYSSFTQLNNNQKAALVEEALNYCAQNNNFDQAKAVIDSSIDLIQAEYQNGNIIKAADHTATHARFTEFALGYEIYLTNILGDDSCFVDNLD